jgi:hypothetical protein
VVDHSVNNVAIMANVTKKATTTTPEERALLEEALIEWRTQQTKKRGNVSLNGFADAIGANRSIVSMWMLGDRPITDAYKKKIASPLFELVGPKAFEILQVNPSDPDFDRLGVIWKYLPLKLRRGMLQQGEKFVKENVSDEERSGSKRTP